jgi:uncharacterized membrane protein
MEENVILVTFGDASRAYEGFANVRQLDGGGQVELVDAGVVERDASGLLSLREGGDEASGTGTLTGGFVGLLVGVLGGPIGVLFGGAVGVIAGSLYDLDRAEETDSVLEHIARDIPIGGTALVLAASEEGPQAVDAAMDALGGSITRYPRKDVEAEIAAADEAARKARREAREQMRRARRESVREKVHAELERLRAKLHAAREKLARH